jgi:hypothetical protein
MTSRGSATCSPAHSGPTVLAAHSYGGQVITSFGTDAPNVVGLVYIAACGLDEGGSIGALLQQGPSTPAVANVDIDSEGFAWIPEHDFLGPFAADIDPVKAKLMYAVQQPLHTSTFEDVMGQVGTGRAVGTFVGDRRHSLVAQSGLRASQVSTSR